MEAAERATMTTDDMSTDYVPLNVACRCEPGFGHLNCQPITWGDLGDPRAALPQS